MLGRLEGKTIHATQNSCANLPINSQLLVKSAATFSSSRGCQVVIQHRGGYTLITEVIVGSELQPNRCDGSDQKLMTNVTVCNSFNNSKCVEVFFKTALRH